MTWDDLKLARDGWLKWGRADQPRWPYIRPIHDRIERAPNGETHCSIHGMGTVVYGEPGAVTLQGSYELLYDSGRGSSTP